MAMTINTNVVSLNSQRNLSLSSNSLGTTMQRLSSGLRVNSAKDDAAGLAISERMQANTKGLAVAARNANDGISLAQTAEGALGKVGDMLQRQRELAVQSSNATNSDSDRAALQAELSQLTSEIDRVAKTTSFNGSKLLDGAFSGAVFQVGANSGDNITVGALTKSTADGLGNVEFGSTTSKNITAADIEGLTEALKDVTLTVGTDKFTLGTMKPAASGQERLGQLVSAINEKTADTGVTAFLEDGAKAGGYTITLKSDSGKNVSMTGLDSLNKAAGAEVKTYAQAQEETLTKAAETLKSGTYASGADAVTATTDFVNAADALLKKIPGFGTTRADTIAGAVEPAKALADAIDTFDNLVGTDFENGGAFDQAKLDAAVKVVTDAVTAALGHADTKKITSALTTADTAVNNLEETTSTVAEINKTAKDLDAARKAFGDAGKPELKLEALADTASAEDIAKRVKELQVSVDNLGLNITNGEVTAHKGIDKVDISTQAGAWEAIKQIDSAIDQVNKARGDLGALQTRFEKTVENIDIQSENITAARGRIVDADFATETANLSRSQILQQAGTAMVAQANQLPQNVLSLLR